MPQTLVAINGLGALEYLWHRFSEALPGELKLRVLDLPGHGDVPPASDYTYGGMVESAVARTSDLERFPLIGWSVGAAGAWLLAARHPERVTHLILLDPAAPHQSRFKDGPTPEPRHVYTLASPAKGVGALSMIFPGVTEDDIRALYRQNDQGRWEPNHDPAIFPVLAEEARNHGEEIFLELGKIKAPVLVLYGQRSFIREDQVREIAAIIQNVAVESVPNAGHFMVGEQPAYLAGRIGAFIQRNG